MAGLAISELFLERLVGRAAVFRIFSMRQRYGAEQSDRRRRREIFAAYAFHDPLMFILHCKNILARVVFYSNADCGVGLPVHNDPEQFVCL